MIEPYYRDASATLYHGDARDICPELGLSFDLILTDPPYGGQQFAGQGVKTQNANIRADGARQGVPLALPPTVAPYLSTESIDFGSMEIP